MRTASRRSAEPSVQQVDCRRQAHDGIFKVLRAGQRAQVVIQRAFQFDDIAGRRDGLREDFGLLQQRVLLLGHLLSIGRQGVAKLVDRLDVEPGLEVALGAALGEELNNNTVDRPSALILTIDVTEALLLCSLLKDLRSTAP